MTLIIGATFILVSYHYARPWTGTAHLDQKICPNFMGHGVHCLNYRHDLALGSFFVGACYFISAGALRLITSARTTLDDALWSFLLPFRWIAGVLSKQARRFVFDVAIIVTLLFLPSVIISILPGGNSRLSDFMRFEVGIIISLSASALISLICAYWETIRKLLTTALREVFIIVVAVVIYIGRVWAGWSLSGVALTVALVVGVAALANWIGLRGAGLS